MAVDNFVNVLLIHIGVPDAFWIDHRHRAAGAAVQTAGFVHPDLARPRQAQGFDAAFAVIEASWCFIDMISSA